MSLLRSPVPQNPTIRTSYGLSLMTCFACHLQGPAMNPADAKPTFKIDRHSNGPWKMVRTKSFVSIARLMIGPISEKLAPSHIWVLTGFCSHMKSVSAKHARDQVTRLTHQLPSKWP
ncbi:hypothetical protein ABBQ38_007900 [Trebouxia sp. C0009 RCD-2024]